MGVKYFILSENQHMKGDLPVCTCSGDNSKRENTVYTQIYIFNSSNLPSADSVSLGVSHRYIEPGVVFIAAQDLTLFPVLSVDRAVNR